MPQPPRDELLQSQNNLVSLQPSTQNCLELGMAIEYHTRLLSLNLAAGSSTTRILLSMTSWVKLI